jgi:hypothetical protein
VYSRPEATGASKDDSGKRLSATKGQAKQRQHFVDAMVLANPSAANGDSRLYLQDPGGSCVTALQKN